MRQKINTKLLFYLVLSFILCTVIGTLSHEGGHIAVAKYCGYETELHFASMNYKKPWQNNFDSVQAIYRRHRFEQENDIRHSESERLDSLEAVIRTHRLDHNEIRKANLITIGGPAQTLLTSIIGVFILLFRRKSIHSNGMKLWDWLAVFLALFSLRFVSNMTLSVFNGLFFGDSSYFGGDEAKLARTYDLPLGTFAIPLFCIGLAISLWVIFTILPHKHRLTFILSGLIGGLAGYFFWLKWLVPSLMP